MRYLIVAAVFLAACRTPITYDIARGAPESEICMAIVMPQVTPQERAVLASVLKDRGQNCSSYRDAMQAQMAINQRNQSDVDMSGYAMRLLNNSGPMYNGMNCRTFTTGQYSTMQCN